MIIASWISDFFVTWGNANPFLMTLIFWGSCGLTALGLIWLRAFMIPPNRRIYLGFRDCVGFVLLGPISLGVTLFCYVACGVKSVVSWRDKKRNQNMAELAHAATAWMEDEGPTQKPKTYNPEKFSPDMTTKKLNELMELLDDHMKETDDWGKSEKPAEEPDSDKKPDTPEETIVTKTDHRFLDI